MAAAALLGRDVVGAADQVAGARQRRQPLLAHEPEVDQQRAAVAAQEDVRRLDVAVEDPALVRMVQRVRDLRERRGGARAVDAPGRVDEAAARDHVGERRPLDQLHREEPGAVAVADLLDVHDVVVAQAGRRIRFAQEALDRGGLQREVRLEDLERDELAAGATARPIDDTHPAAADLAFDHEIAEDAPFRRRRMPHRLPPTTVRTPEGYRARIGAAVSFPVGVVPRPRVLCGPLRPCPRGGG